MTTTTNWPLTLSRRCKGNQVFVDSWALEKLLAAIEDVTSGFGRAGNLEAARNLTKLVVWMAGNNTSWEQWEMENAFELGQDGMRLYVEYLLAPILEEP